MRIHRGPSLAIARKACRSVVSPVQQVLKYSYEAARRDWRSISAA